MSKINKDQSGFSVVEGLLITVVILLIGFIGYYAYNAQKNADKTSNATTSSTPKAEKETTAEVANISTGWLQYDAPNGKYSIKLPDGWNLVSYQSGSAPYTTAAQDITYTKGTKATVKATSFAGDISTVAFSMSSDVDGFFGQEPRGTVKATFKTNQGLEVKRYDYVSDGSLYPAGMTRYDYRITDAGKSFQVVHDVKQGEKSQTSLIEDSLHTVKMQ